ncbi:MAG: GTP-binding protein, partial [Candidatus Aenigmarchaeota archaeon]|nr:GTP-binding protein [Candidatus Aenigmarchaeota archaeon]
AGKTRMFLDTLPHEIQRGLSAELAYALYGFKNGKPMKLKNPLDKKERSRIVDECEKIISFVDTVGHEPWLRTTIRGLVGQSVDYGLLTIGIDSGITKITKEHLGILLALGIPVIVVLTKIDRFDEKRIKEVEEEVEKMLKYIGKVPFRIKSKQDVALVVDRLDVIVPIIQTSAKTLEGYELLDELLLHLNPRRRELERPFLMYIDKVYNIKGVGTVVSGTVKQGEIETGSEVLLGPFKTGEFKRVKATSIQTHYHPLDKVKAGFVVGVALRGVKYEDVHRGMVICDPELNPSAIWRFEADILVLNHPTCVKVGYEPVVHVNTIAETAKIEWLEKEYLKAGESGRAIMKFKFRPHFIQPGEKFVFREGKTKGIGTILRVV